MRRLSGFSLMEMMVVLLITSVIAAASAPMISKKMSSNGGSGGVSSGSSSGGCYWAKQNLSPSIFFAALKNGDNTKTPPSVMIGATKAPSDNPRLYINTNSSGDKVFPHIKFNSEKGSAFKMVAGHNGNVWLSSNDYSADATNSVVLGQDVKASAKSVVAIGDNIQAEKESSIAIGKGITSSGPSAITIGEEARTISDFDIAIGARTSAKSGSIAIGYGATSKAKDAIAIGNDNSTLAENDNAIAIGSSANASGNKSIAIGNGAVSKNKGSIAIGNGASAQDNYGYSNVAIGNGAKADTLRGIAIGAGAVAKGLDTIVISSSIAGATEVGSSSVVIGSGANKADIPSSSTIVGANATTVDGNSKGIGGTAIGRSAKATGSYSTALGYSAQATKDNQIVINTNNTATGKEIVLGDANTKVIIKGDLELDKDLIVNSLTSKGSVYVKDHLYVGKRGIFGLNQYQELSRNGFTQREGDTSLIIGAIAWDDDEDENSWVHCGGPESHGWWHYMGVTREEGNTNMRAAVSTKIDKVGGHKDIQNIVSQAKKYLNAHVESDRRLKNVGKAFVGGLEEIKKLEVFHFTYKNDEAKTPHVGIMAQDLQKIFPDAVMKGEDGFLRIRMEDMFYALVNAVKELDAKISTIANKDVPDLKRQVSDLQKQNEELLKRIEALEKKKK